MKGVIGATVVQNILISFAIPLFMFVAGITLFHKAQKPHDIGELESYYVEITLRLGLPNFIFTNITGFIQNVYDGEIIKGAIHLIVPFMCVLIVVLRTRKLISTLYKVLLLGVFVLTMTNNMSNFWFLGNLMQTLVLLAFCSWIAKLIDRNGKKWHIGVFILLMTIYPSTFSGTMEFMVYFVMGGLLRQFFLSEKTKIALIFNRNFYCLVTVSFLSALIFFVLFDFKDFYNYNAKLLMKNGELCTYIFRQSCAISWIIFWTVISICFSKKHTDFSKWGRQTLELYLIHVTLITIPSVRNTSPMP